MSGTGLVTISEASRLLGVSEAALRQWTDEGKIRAFITPGGHRRYPKADLERLVVSRQKVLGLKDLVAELEETTQRHREIARASLSASSWYSKLSEGSQEHLADLSRRLLNLIIRYMTQPSKREETIKLVREVGYGFGETLSGAGLSLTDSVEAFLQHRDPVMKATTHLLRRKEAYTGHVVEAIPLVGRAMDEALVSLVAAYQHRRETLQSEFGEGSGK